MNQDTLVPVLFLLVHLPRVLLDKTIFVKLATQMCGKLSGTLMTLCGTHRGVQVGALAVIVVVHGSLPH